MNPYSPNAKMLTYLGLAGEFPSKGTLYVRSVVTNTMNETREEFAASVVITNIDCRITPMITLRPTREELVGEVATTVNTQRMCMLKAYFAEGVIKREDRFQVDGVMYEITAVEPDGNKVYTRLGLKEL